MPAYYFFKVMGELTLCMTRTLKNPHYTQREASYGNSSKPGHHASETDGMNRIPYDFRMQMTRPIREL